MAVRDVRHRRPSSLFSARAPPGRIRQASSAANWQGQRGRTPLALVIPQSGRSYGRAHMLIFTVTFTVVLTAVLILISEMTDLCEMTDSRELTDSSVR